MLMKLSITNMLPYFLTANLLGSDILVTLSQQIMPSLEPLSHLLIMNKR